MQWGGEREGWLSGGVSEGGVGVYGVWFLWGGLGQYVCEVKVGCSAARSVSPPSLLSPPPLPPLDESKLKSRMSYPGTK